MGDFYTVLEASHGETQYDQYAKQIIAYKPILANILVHTVEHFKDQDPEDIIPLIEDDIRIGTAPVSPGLTNQKNEYGTMKIAGMNTESKVPNEGVRYFDIIFYVKTLDGLSKIIINIEVQKKDPSEYDIEMRGLYYAVRELSSQLDRDFTKMDYNSINKVYSIWICMNHKENSIQEIHLTPRTHLGNARWKDMYEILNVIVIRMKNELDSDLSHKLHRLLGAIFLNSLSIEQKKAILKDEHSINISDDRKEMLSSMCNLGEGIFEQGIEQGIEIGVEQGIELGFFKSIKRLLSTGMPEAKVTELLQATPEQIQKAKELVINESN